MRMIGLIAASLLLSLPLPINAAAAESTKISGRLIGKLASSLSEVSAVESTVEQRRLLKRIIRRAYLLLEDHPKAPNRFRVIGIVFQTQKQMLLLRNDEENQRALLKTAQLLRTAPDEYAGEKLEADVLLTQLKLESDGATAYEQALALAAVADRYRETPAEMDCLIMVSQIAFNLGHAELLRAFRGTLASKFKEEPKAIGFLKERFASKSSSLLFRGEFKVEGGGTLSLPMDRAGHVYLSCFWSNDTRDLRAKLLEIEEVRKKYAGQFEVLSFNLDELPDAGLSTLKGLSLDWTVLHLPNGRNNELFRSCTLNKDFLIRMTNVNGYIILTPIGSTLRYSRPKTVDDYAWFTVDLPRFRSLVQTARIGDFLILDPVKPFDRSAPPELASGPVKTLKWGPASVPVAALDAIQACFTPPPMRYRLSTAAALKNYTNAVRLCDAAIKQHHKSEHLWLVHNRKMIALVGMWNLGREPKHLENAAAAANLVLAMDIPREAKTVARFCRAKAALRKGKDDAKTLLSGFIEAEGGDKASALAVGAAAVLSIDAASPSDYVSFRDRLLDNHMSDSRVWSLTAYFFDKFISGRLFRGNYYSSHMRIYHGFREWQKRTETRPRQFGMQLKNFKGQNVEFPKKDPDTSNAIIFVQHSKDAESAKLQIEMVKRLNDLANKHLRKKLNLAVAFVDDDVARVTSQVGKNGWGGLQVAIVPGGERNPNILRLGVLLADQRPNTYMVAHDGRIVWGFSGMYQMSAGTNGVPGTVMDLTQRHDLKVGNQALEKRDYKKALDVFKGSFPEYPRKAPHLTNAQRTGQSRAMVGLKDWEGALPGIDMVVQNHEKGSLRGRCACHSLAEKLFVKAEMLGKLGKEKEAAAVKARADQLTCPAGSPRPLSGSRYEHEIYRKIDSFRRREEWEAGLAYIDEIIVAGRDGKQGVRDELARTLKSRSEILKQLGEAKKAGQDLARAKALLEGIRVPANQEKATLSRRYVDIVKETSHKY